MQKNSIIKSIVIFIISISILLLLKNSNTIASQYLITEVNQYVLDKSVNDKFIFEKTVRIKSSEYGIILTECIFYKKGEDALAMNVGIDIFTEFVLPLILIIAISIAFPMRIKLRLLFVFLSFLLGIIVFEIKILIMIFDNFNNPDFTLIDFSFPIYQIIYYSNLMLKTTGTSVNLIISILVIAVSLIPFYKHIELN